MGSKGEEREAGGGEGGSGRQEEAEGGKGGRGRRERQADPDPSSQDEMRKISLIMAESRAH